MDASNDLISFIASMSGEGSLRVEENLGGGYVKLRVSEAERRQAKHDIQHVEDIVVEMLRNARDAGASAVFVATGKTAERRSLLFIDDGCGVPDGMRERIFDARVTSKLETMKMDRWGVHGRGMALFSIRENAEEARVVESGDGLGSAFFVIVDTASLPERADQSTWPSLVKDEDGKLSCGKGPHNILRAISEFALEEHHGCDVYVGSPTEVAATLYANGSRRVDASRLLFIDDEAELPVVDRLAFASDAAEFIRIAASIGIDISERTAHRILSGAIEPLRNVASRLLREGGGVTRNHDIDLSRDRRGLKISRQDIDEFARLLERDFQMISDRYYVSLSSEPRVRVTRDAVTVTFPITKDE